MRLASQQVSLTDTCFEMSAARGVAFSPQQPSTGACTFFSILKERQVVFSPLTLCREFGTLSSELSSEWFP
jgi:hypothetical protein